MLSGPKLASRADGEEGVPAGEEQQRSGCLLDLFDRQAGAG
jgi:hypothetical protein